jgi:hypothetical protein
LSADSTPSFKVPEIIQQWGNDHVEDSPLELFVIKFHVVCFRPEKALFHHVVISTAAFGADLVKDARGCFQVGHSFYWVSVLGKRAQRRELLAQRELDQG